MAAAVRPGPRCSICAHPRRVQIERAWLERRSTRKQIADEYQVSYRQLINHYQRGHVRRDIVAAGRAAKEQERAAKISQTILESLDDYRARIGAALDRTDEILKDRDNKDVGVILGTIREQMSSIREATRLLELRGKLTGELDTAKYNLFILPVWTDTRNMILDALEDFPEARLAVLQRLKAVKQQALAALPAPIADEVIETQATVVEGNNEGMAS